MRGQKNAMTISKLAGLTSGASLLALCAATAASAQPLASPLIPTTIRSQTTTPTEPERNYLRPRIGVEAAVTDNVTSVSTNKQSDTMGRATVGLGARYNSPRAQILADGDLNYDVYAKNQKYDTLSFNGEASAKMVLAPELLAIEAAGFNTQGSTSSMGSTESYRSANNDDYQVGSYYFGPHLSLTPNFADISAVARYGQVYFDGVDTSPVQSLSDKTSFYQVIGAADTKDRLGRLRFVTSGQYQADDRDFSSTGGSVSGFFQVTPRFTGIVRVGYDDTKLNSLLKVNGTFWSVGGQLTYGERGTLRFEGGERYGDTFWSGQTLYRVNRVLTLAGDVSSSLETGAIGVSNVLVDYVGGLNDPLPMPNLQQGFYLGTSFFDEASLNRSGNLHALFDLGKQKFDLQAHVTQRKFLTTDATYRTLSDSVTYTNQLRPDLQLGLSFTHATDHSGGNVLIGGDGGSYYRTLARLDYDLNSRTRLGVGYMNRRYRPGAGSFIGPYDENAASISLVRTFR